MENEHINKIFRLERLAALLFISFIMLLCMRQLNELESRDVTAAENDMLYYINMEEQADMESPEDYASYAVLENDGEDALKVSDEEEQTVTAAAYLSGELDDELSAEEAISGYAELKGYSLSDYPDELIEVYRKYADAREYVLEYPEKKDIVYDINLDEYKDCTDVPLLMQWDERWGYGTYAGGIFGHTACGPTCLSMAAIYLLGDTDMNPKWMAEFATENGYSTDGHGSAWTLFSVGAAQLGMQVSELSLNEDSMKQSLDEGGLIVCIVGPGDFTDGGHFILIKGYDDEGFIVNDPNSYTNSAKRWNFDTLRPQIRDLWKLATIHG
jgi:hypothetical protein